MRVLVVYSVQIKHRFILQNPQTQHSEVAAACGLDDAGALFLPFSNPVLNNDPPSIPALIEREMLARHTALGLEPEVGF